MVAEMRRSKREAAIESNIKSVARQSLPKHNRGGPGRPKKSVADGGDENLVKPRQPSKKGGRTKGVGLSIGSASRNRIKGRAAPQGNLGEWAKAGYSHEVLFRDNTLEAMAKAGSRLEEMYKMYQKMSASEKQSFKRKQESDAKQGRGAQPSALW